MTTPDPKKEDSPTPGPDGDGNGADLAKIFRDIEDRQALDDAEDGASEEQI